MGVKLVVGGGFFRLVLLRGRWPDGGWGGGRGVEAKVKLGFGWGGVGGAGEIAAPQPIERPRGRLVLRLR